MNGSNQLITVNPEELKFQFELEKQSYCDIKVTNNTEHNVAFKVKTTSPKKYFVRPNTGVIHPWDSSIIRVTLQAQREYPPDMQCKDKFLLQTTTVSSQTDLDELPPDTFNKDSGKRIEECKLRVLYIAPNGGSRSPEEDTFRSFGSSMQRSISFDDNQSLQRHKSERDAAVQQAHQLQQELELLKRRKIRKGDPGFSFKFALLVGIIGIMVGFLLNFILSSPPPTE